MRQLIIIQTVTPDYRKAFFDEIRSKLGKNFELYRGSDYFEKSVVTDYRINAHNCKNYFLFGRRVLFQTGIKSTLFSKAVVVLEMNPRVLSNWMLLLIRGFSGRKTVLWGHAWPRKGKDSNSDILRHLMRLLSTTIITYTSTQREELLQRMPNKTIYAAPNALFSKNQMFVQDNVHKAKNLIYVGRLTESKKPFFLVKAFANAIAQLPEEMNLIIVGSGEEERRLEKFIQQNDLESRILLKGHISDINELRDLYEQSFFSISPGYLGLSVTQSFGFGVPMLVSKYENHSPEIEAILENKNAIFFDTDDEVSFRESVLRTIKNREYWIEQRPEIQEFCRENYSVEAMAQVFTNLVKTYDA